MFLHYSIILFIQKQRGNKPDQENYNNLFFSIESNLRELGFGDVSVNKKMKILNKIFYDILVKLKITQNHFKLNKILLNKYFNKINNNVDKIDKFNLYFDNFYNFCFELPSKNMIDDVIKFKF
jgi:cytochrome b pre-mRNA-processing protein 3